MEKETTKPQLIISKSDYQDIINTGVATPVLCDEIENQLENKDDFEIIIDKQ